MKPYDLRLLLTLFFHGLQKTVERSPLIPLYFRLNSRCGNPGMQTIREENYPEDEPQTARGTSIKRTNQRGKHLRSNSFQ